MCLKTRAGSLGIISGLLILFGADAFAALRGKPVKDSSGCEIALTADKRTAGVEILLREEKISDPLENMFVNEPRRIARETYDVMPSRDRQMKMAEARRLGNKIADEILKPEIIESDDRMVRIHNLLSTRLGVFPPQVFDSLNRILGADLSSLRVPDAVNEKTGAETFKHLRYNENTNNHVAEIERIMTEYRQSGLKLNLTATLISHLPGGKKPAQILLEKYQTALDAVQVVLESFSDDIGEFYMLHEEMRQARLACQALDLYEQIAAVAADQIHERFREWIEHSGKSEEEIEAFVEDAVSPLAQRQQMITGVRSTAVLGYTMFRLLMANNQRLIVIYGNLRDLADVKMRIAGGGKILINKQTMAIDRAESAYRAMTALDEQSVKQLKSLGRRILDFPALVVAPANERAVELIQEVVDEIASVRKGDVQTINNLVNGARALNARLDDLGRRGGLDDFMVESDQITKEYGVGRDVDRLPEINAAVKN